MLHMKGTDRNTCLKPELYASDFDIGETFWWVGQQWGEMAMFGNTMLLFGSRVAEADSKLALAHFGFLPSELWGGVQCWVSNGQKVTWKCNSVPSGIWHNWVTGRDCLSRWHESLSSNSSCLYNQTITSPEHRLLALWETYWKLIQCS